MRLLTLKRIVRCDELLLAVEQTATVRWQLSERPGISMAALRRASPRRGLAGRPRLRRSDVRSTRQRLVEDAAERLIALLLLIVVALIAGLFLGSSTERLEDLPGLLLMVPAAIALRGNIFGALGSRLSTSIHAGTFRLSLRSTSVVGENLIASVILTLLSSVVLAVFAKCVAIAFGIADSITLWQFVMISVAGGLGASVVVMLTALALAAGSVRFGWDPDNVTAPLVTAAGDVATVPALVIASLLVDNAALVAGVSVAAGVLAPAAVLWVVRAGRSGLRTIVYESSPVLVFGIVLDLIAGVTVERQLDSFARHPALLVLLPAFLAVAGALGGTLSSRLSSRLHLGIIVPSRWPEARARADLVGTLVLAVPAFGTAGLLAHVLASWAGLSSPGVGWLVAAAMIGGAAASLLSVAVAYYSTIASVRVGLDPDTYGIPVVTSALDLLGAFTLIVAVALLGFT